MNKKTVSEDRITWVDTERHMLLDGVPLEHLMNTASLQCHTHEDCSEDVDEAEANAYTNVTVSLAKLKSAATRLKTDLNRALAYKYDRMYETSE